MPYLAQLLLLSVTVALGSSVSAGNLDLSTRESPIPRTTDGIPHVQIDVEPVPEISKELLRRVSEMPGIEIHPTIVSLPGALGFWIAEDINLARPDVIVRGREFAHIHPDGSLHASLSPELATRAVGAGWAVHHPWANERPGWEGFVMIFTPVTKGELDVVLNLIKASFEYVTGQELTSM